MFFWHFTWANFNLTGSWSELCFCKNLIQLHGSGGVTLEMHSILNSYGFVLGYVEFCFVSLVVLLFTYDCLVVLPDHSL